MNDRALSDSTRGMYTYLGKKQHGKHISQLTVFVIRNNIYANWFYLITSVPLPQK